MKKLMALVALATLQGCASMAGTGTSQDFSSLHLFGADGQPRFALDLACAGKTSDQTLQCTTVRRAFTAWSDARHVRMRSIEMDDPLFSNQAMPAGSELTVAIQFQPDVIPSYDEWHGSQGNMSSGHVNGRVGYEATVYVFSAAGALLRKFPAREHVEIPDHTNVTPFIKAAASDVIARLDPGYARPQP
jgi:hypothetical protein